MKTFFCLLAKDVKSVLKYVRGVNWGEFCYAMFIYVMVHAIPILLCCSPFLIYIWLRDHGWIKD